MIEWIYNRPPKACNNSEIRVAELLKGLADSPHLWTVIWGYYYTDSRGTRREGDFLILGPHGGLLVLEVKTRLPRHFPETGRSEGAGESDPIQQLHEEWQGVINGIGEKGPVPFVEKALCVPDAKVPPELERYQGMDRQWLVSGNNFANWNATWQRIFKKRTRYLVSAEERRAVIAAFGQGSLPKEKRSFINHTEEIFRRQFQARFALLDQISDNRQLLVRGGTGTGKTWHALEQALRYARQDDGKDVLFLTYNKALTVQLRRLVSLHQIDTGSVIVRGWEELFRELLELAGQKIQLPPPGSGREVIQSFYEIELPQQVLEASRDPELRAQWPIFDALVVDEGQDHDTCWHSEIRHSECEAGGWWHIYQLLLRNHRNSPASMFYDKAQRPPFRAAERFEPETLAAIWSQPAHVRLQPAVRYTRPLWQFISSHPSPATAGMIEALGNGDHLPEGPEPEVHVCPANADAGEIIATILTRWQASGLCDPTEVLILHAQSSISRSPIGQRETIAEWNLHECTEGENGPHCIQHTSIHKAKGLDSKAVIVIGLPPQQDLVDDDEHYTWFMAVSRARQLLAIIETPSPD